MHSVAIAQWLSVCVDPGVGLIFEPWKESPCTTITYT